jgi:hypothetical protein
MSTPPHTSRAVYVSGTTKVHFDGFAGLPAQRDEEVLSEEFTCLGNSWYLQIYPGGDAYAEEGMVSVYLYNMSHKRITIECGISVEDCVEVEMASAIFDLMDDDGAWGDTNFAMRSKVIDSLVDGALVIEVHMKLVDRTKPFIPENPSCKIIQGMFMDEEFADIAFEVGGQQSKRNARKKAKNSSVTFPAHRLIVRKCSSTLADLCGSAGDKTTPIQIPDVSPDIFHHLLFHLYGGKVADADMKSHAKEIIAAADKYGVVDLKLEAEASLVRATTFNMENLLDLLLFADSKNCALLKEAAMDYMVVNNGEVRKKISFNDAPGALIIDVLAAFGRGETMGGTEGGNELSVMRISELRRKAHESGLDVDGSREMLIAALEEN